MLEVQEDGEAWVTLFTDQCSGTYTYDADCGHAYNFRVTATDNRGNFASAEVGVNVLRITKYYYAAGQRLAMRRDGVLTYLHGDHLGSASLATDANGAKLNAMRYYPLRQAQGRPTGRRAAARYPPTIATPTTPLRLEPLGRPASASRRVWACTITTRGITTP